MTVIERVLPDEKATALLGEDIAAALRPGDVVALKGDLGAGKTTLARALVRALAGDPGLDVPSPTFTLVQAYEARLPVAHFDLYRIGSPAELDELGFAEAAADGVVLVEWPDRAGDRLPADAIVVELTQLGDGRLARISGGRRDGAARALARDARFSGRCRLAGRASHISHRRRLGARLRDGQPGRLGAGHPDEFSAAGAGAAGARRQGLCRDRPYGALGFGVRGDRPPAARGRLRRAGDPCAGPRRRLPAHRESRVGQVSSGRDGEPVAERYEAAAELLADLHRQVAGPRRRKSRRA